MASTVPGTLKVSNDCLADLAGYAALECYGVVGMAEIDEQAGVARLLPAYRLRKGVDVSSSSQGVCVDLHVVVEQGVNMASVKFLLRQIAELENVKVTVHIEAMRASR